MADSIPAKLRQADITRFLNRANQLRQFKPAITYWCEYWVVTQILQKQLHNEDEESLAFTTNLMDQLERTKSEHAEEEAITDETVGQAVVEQFAQQTFDRAERTMTANKVTRQTADTFDAASTFFQLLNAWGPLDAEVQKKIKYSKWNAARILRAIKEGNDPNESNPKHEEPSPEAAAEDAELEQLVGGAVPPPVTVEDDPDADFYQRQTAETSTPAANVPIPPSKSPSEANFPQSAGPALPSVSDLGPPSVQTPAGYFPPTQSFPTSPNETSAAGPPAPPPQASTGPFMSPVNQAPWQPPPAPQAAPAPHPNMAMSPPALPTPQYQPPPPQTYTEPVQALQEEGDIPGATKHARFAISALNFEDVPTAVKELRAALAALNARY